MQKVKYMQRWLNAASEIEENRASFDAHAEPLPGIRMGVSVENQKSTKSRVDYLPVRGDRVW